MTGVGWGQTPSTSQRITAKSQMDRAAVALSAAVENWRDAPSKASAAAVCDRHDDFKAAHAATFVAAGTRQ